MNDTKHSALPFALCGDSEILSAADTHEGMVIAETHLMHGQDPTQYTADAEFIVRACNAHYDLLAACEHVLKGIEMFPVGNSANGPTAQILRAAISKAKDGAA